MPAPPLMTSAPAPPSRRLLPLLPKSALARAVAEALQVGAALQDQIFHVRRQREVDGREHRVVALAGILDRRRRRYCRRSRRRCRAPPIMASAPAPPSRRLLPVLPKSAFASAVAVALQVGAALQDQVLDVRRQPAVDRGKHRVVALAGALDRLCRCCCRRNRCRCRRRRHGVGAGAAVEEIVAGIAEERVDQAVAVALQVGAALQDQSSRRWPTARS